MVLPPKSSILYNRTFHHKQSMLGMSHFRTPPYLLCSKIFRPGHEEQHHPDLRYHPCTCEPEGASFSRCRSLHGLFEMGVISWLQVFSCHGGVVLINVGS